MKDDATTVATEDTWRLVRFRKGYRMPAADVDLDAIPLEHHGDACGADFGNPCICIISTVWGFEIAR